MFCNKCGKESNDNVKFCTYCGAEMNGSAAPIESKPAQLAPTPQIVVESNSHIIENYIMGKKVCAIIGIMCAIIAIISLFLPFAKSEILGINVNFYNFGMMTIDGKAHDFEKDIMEKAIDRQLFGSEFFSDPDNLAVATAAAAAVMLIAGVFIACSFFAPGILLMFISAGINVMLVQNVGDYAFEALGKAPDPGISPILFLIMVVVMILVCIIGQRYKTLWKKELKKQQ